MWYHLISEYFTTENMWGGLSMPGNEVGDKIYNFFGQQNLSLGQQHSEVVDRAWPTLSNSPWAQIGEPLVSNLKNQNVQESADSESELGGQSSGIQYDENFSQQSIRPEFAIYESQSRPSALNGHMHGHPVSMARQNEANFMGMDLESDRNNLTLQGFLVFDSQLGNSTELNQKNSVRTEFTESPVNYDFFGGQQKMNSQHPVMIQSLPRQQSEISDMQLLQQQFILKQMQEIQRQQHFQKHQLQQQEASQLNSMNQVSSFAEQAVGSRSSPMINGIPIHDSSNYLWKPELATANPNWPLHGVPPFMQGSSCGLIFPNQDQTSCLVSMVPQQVDQSLQGIPISGTRAVSSRYSPIQIAKPPMQQMSGSTIFQGNQYTGSPDQISMRDGMLASRQGYQSNNMMGIVDGQGLSCGINFENWQQVNPKQNHTQVQEFSWRQDVPRESEMSRENTGMQVSSSQKVASLDATEEKILFGSDDKLWDAFGKGTMLDGVDSIAYPSVQSGSWSALMQSAVAETSSSAVQQEEWSGLNFHNNELPVGNQHSPTYSESQKGPSSQVYNSLQVPSTATAVNKNSIPVVKQYGLHEQSLSLQAGSSPSLIQHFLGEQTKNLDCSFPQRPVIEGSRIFGKLSHSLDAESHAKSISSSWVNKQSMLLYNTGSQQSNGPNGWNFTDSLSPSMSPAQKNQGNGNSLQVCQRTEAVEQAAICQSVDASFDSFPMQSKQMSESFEKSQTSQSALLLVAEMSASHPNLVTSDEMSHPDNDNQKHGGKSTQQFTVLEAKQALPCYTLSGMSEDGDSSKKSSAVWTNVSDLQHSLGAQPQHFKARHNLFKFNHHADSETTSLSSSLENKNELAKGNDRSESGPWFVNSHCLTEEKMAKGERCQQISANNDSVQMTLSLSQGEELTSSFLSNTPSTEREIEAFGWIQRPVNFLHQNYSLLHQMQNMKITEFDPSNRSLKRLKGLDGAVDSQVLARQGGQLFTEHCNIVGEAEISHTSTLSGDSKILTFLPKQADEQDTKATSQDMFTFGQNNSQNLSDGCSFAPFRAEHSQISPQMASSWFDQYGTFKNGPPMYDARKMAAMKNLELPLTVGKSSDGLHAHDSMEQSAVLAAGAVWHSIVQESATASLLKSDNLSSQLLCPDAANASLVVLQPKKHTSATSKIIPWHKVVMQGPWMLQNISTVEVDWARAADLLPEKVEDKTEMVKDGPPHIRSKRRLILTTQLMQLLIGPPPASVLFADAISCYENVAHYTARSTLGDVCRALSFTGSDTPAPYSSRNILPERITDQVFSKVMEDLISRAKKLENDLLRLDNRGSVLDFRVECQDLEKFSVINRFAKFHGRSQVDGALTSNALKNCPQRYVTALPMPRNLPDRVQCLSL